AAYMALGQFVALARQQAALGKIDPGAAQPADGPLEPAGRDVAGDQLAAIAHPGGERQGLATRPGTEIDDTHSRPGIGEECGNLRALVLHLDEPFLERSKAAERRPL